MIFKRHLAVLITVIMALSMAVQPGAAFAAGGAADSGGPAGSGGAAAEEAVAQPGYGPATMGSDGRLDGGEGAAGGEGPGAGDGEEGSAGTEEGSAGTEEGSAGTEEGSAGAEEGRPGDKEGSAGDKEGSAGAGAGDEEGGAGAEEEAAVTEEDIEAIEDLTVDAAEGIDFDGYIVKVKADEVSEEMIEAAPEEPIAEDLFVVEEPLDALEFAAPDQIEVIEPNYYIQSFDFPQTPPDDPNFTTNQWNLKDPYGVKAQGAWSRGLSGAGVRVAVIDSGINAYHQDFGSGTLVKDGFAFNSSNGAYLGSVAANGLSVVSDGFGHGTMVSSIIAAIANNGLNIAGLAYGAEIVPFKVMSDSGTGTLSPLAAALNYIAANNDTLGIGVVNISLGAHLDPPSASLQSAIDAVTSKGIIVVAAVGNGYEYPVGSGIKDYTALMYPAACTGVIGVASTGQTGLKSSFSQYNSSVDVAAPGESIWGLVNTNTTGSKSGQGTSYASPLAAAAAALLKEIDPGADGDDFLALLEETSVPKPGGHKSPEYGFGLLDAKKIAESYYKYTVMYTWDGVPDDSMTEINYMLRGSGSPTLILSDVWADRAGYTLSGYDLSGAAIPASQASAAIADGDVLVVEYVSDPNIVVTYYVDYEYGGVIDGAKRETQYVWAGNPVVTAGDIVSKPMAGYQAVGTAPALPLSVTEGQTIKCIYSSDPTQKVDYTVRYLYDGAADPGLTAVLSAWIGNQVAQIPASVANTKPGYAFAGFSLNGEPVEASAFPVPVEEGDVLDVRYAADYSQTVTYYIDYEYGGTVDMEERETKNVWAGDPSVAAGSVPQKPRAGYVYSVTVPVLPAAVFHGQQIKVVYAADYGQTISYTVRYLYEGAADDGLTETGSVWAGDPALAEDGIEQKPRQGYTLAGYMQNGVPAGAGDFPLVLEEGDVIDLCYTLLEAVYDFENGNWYKYGLDGLLVTGWVGNQYYYTAADGRPVGSRASGLAFVPGKNSDVRRLCYFDPETGDVVSGLASIGGYIYYFRGEAGMATDEVVTLDDGRVFSFDANGRAIMGWRTEAAGKKYYDKNGRAAGVKKISGKFYYFNRATGVLNTAIKMISDSATGAYYYCYSAKGYLRTGKFTASSKTYYADKKTAALVTGQVKNGSYYYYYAAEQGRLKNVERDWNGKYWFYGSDGKRTSGWVTYNSTTAAGTQSRHKPGDKVYYNKTKGLLTGAQKIGSHMYWLIPERYGALWTAIGAVVDSRGPGNPVCYYCYSSKGYLRVGGNQEIMGVKYYFDSKGRLANGPVKSGSYLYYFQNGVKIVPGSAKLEGGGVWPAASFWHGEGGNWYYITAPKGRLKTGKFTDPMPNPVTGAVSTPLYFSTSTGAAVTGRVKAGSYNYYYDGMKGLVTAQGWLGPDKTADGKTYYVTGTGGRLKTGVFTDPAAHYSTGELYVQHFFNKSNASLYTGQVKIGSYYYYFEGAGRAGLVRGGERVVKAGKGAQYYRPGDGRRVTGWVTFAPRDGTGGMTAMYAPEGSRHTAGDRVYYSSSKGLLTGIQKIGGRFYWLDEARDGAMYRYTGYGGGRLIEVKDQGSGAIKLYYCDSDKGYLKTGKFTARLDSAAGVGDGRNWHSKETRSYYANAKTAALSTGPVKIGSYYFFYDSRAYALVKSDGAAAWIRDGVKRYCTTRADGRLKAGSATVGGEQYYFGSKGVMLTNAEKKISGKWYFYGEEGARVKNSWLEMPDGRLVYYGSSGARHAGAKKVSFTDNGKKYEYTYYFNKTTGAKKTGWVTASGKTYYYDPAWPAAKSGKDAYGRAIRLVEPGARATGEWTVNGKELYFKPSNGSLLTGEVKLSVKYPTSTSAAKSYYFYYDGKNGKLFGKEKKTGGYYYYYRAKGEEPGFVFDKDGKTLKAGFADAPVEGPSGSRVKGWWKMSAGDLKYFSTASASEGRRLHGRQQLPRYNYTPPAKYSSSVKAYYFLDLSNGTIRRSDCGNYQGYLWETNAYGEITKWATVGNVLRGVDVSYWNGYSIDWKKTRSSGVQFVIARAGYTTIDGDKFEIDSTFAGNVKRARAAGVFVGAYIYVYARNTAELNQAIDQFAREMAQNGISPKSLDLPVFLDIEDSKYFLPSTNSLGGYNYRTDMIRAGMKRLESKGYKAGFYTFLSWANSQFDAKKLSKEGYSFWLASWYANNAELNPNTASWNGDYPAVWQYRSTGSVPGISGRVDMNYLYSTRVKWV